MGRCYRCYPHLSVEERRKLAKWRDAKMPIPEIADRLGRAPSTIYRELKRNPCPSPRGARSPSTAASSSARGAI